MGKKSEQHHTCVVCGDGSWSSTKHHFPQNNPELLAKWVSILKLEGIKKITISHKVCEKHFAKDQYIRTRLKKNAVPMPPGGKYKRVERNDREVKPDTSCQVPTKDLWVDEINLLGHCFICLEALDSSNYRPQTLINPPWSSFSHLWPYFTVDSSSAIDLTVRCTFHQGENLKGGSSKIPPMCSSCLPMLEKLHSLHQGLEETRKKLMELTKSVDATACSIRNTLLISSKQKRKDVVTSLERSDLPPSCIRNTTKFLDSLSGPAPAYNLLPIAPNPVSISNPIAIFPSVNSSVNLNQNLIVVNATPYLAGQGCSQAGGNSVMTPPIDLISSTVTFSKPGVIGHVPSSSEKVPIEKLGDNTKLQGKCKKSSKTKISTHVKKKRMISEQFQDNAHALVCPSNQTRWKDVKNTNRSTSRIIPDTDPPSDDEELIDVPDPSIHESNLETKIELDDDDYDYGDAGSDDPLA